MIMMMVMMMIVMMMIDDDDNAYPCRTFALLRGHWMHNCLKIYFLFDVSNKNYCLKVDFLFGVSNMYNCLKMGCQNQFEKNFNKI